MASGGGGGVAGGVDEGPAALRMPASAGCPPPARRALLPAAHPC